MRRKRKRANPVFNVKPDGDEQFVLQRCATYLHRHLRSHHGMEETTIQFLCWVLGDRKMQLSEYLLKQLSGSRHREFENELKESCPESDDYVDLLARTLRKTPPSALRRFEQKVAEILEQRIQQLGDGEQSKIQENMVFFGQMFNLNEQELEFCIFLFILSTFEVAEDFFVNHLGCGKFSGRRHLINALQLSSNELNDVLSGTLRKIEAFDMDAFDMRLREDYLNLILNPANRSIVEEFFAPVTRDAIPLEYHFRDKQETECILRLLQQRPGTSYLTVWSSGHRQKLVRPWYSGGARNPGL